MEAQGARGDTDIHTHTNTHARVRAHRWVSPPPEALALVEQLIASHLLGPLPRLLALLGATSSGGSSASGGSSGAQGASVAGPAAAAAGGAAGGSAGGAAGASHAQRMQLHSTVVKVRAGVWRAGVGLSLLTAGTRTHTCVRTHARTPCRPRTHTYAHCLAAPALRAADQGRARGHARRPAGL